MSVFSKDKVTQVKEFLSVTKNIVIVAHKSPDGDSVGSSVGLFHYLKAKGFQAQICHPDPAPYFLEWMNGSETIINAENNLSDVQSFIAKADLIFCLDFNTLSRTGILEGLIANSTAKKIVIDHHLNPNEEEFDLVFSDTSACATAQLVVDFIGAMGDDDLLNKEMGEALYCGIMTDSGSFRFPSVTAHTHNVVAKLMNHGLKPYVVHESVFDTNTFTKKRLWSHAIGNKTEILEDFKTAIISLEKEDLDQFNYIKGDTEGLVNEGLSLIGIKKSILLLEMDGIIKISFRSKGEDNPVNTMASKYFHGGGHANAAGGRWDGGMKSAIEKIISVLPEYN